MPELRKGLTPKWTTKDGETVRLYLGDVCDVLRRMPAKWVQMICTSPPYWGLRSYDTGDVKHLEIGNEARHDCLSWANGVNCAEDDWAGGCYVCRTVVICRELRRVLRDDGVMWWNLGDSYAGSGKGQNADGTHNHKAGDKQHTNKGAVTGGLRMQRPVRPQGGNSCRNGRTNASSQSSPPPTDLPGGNLIGVPWRVALALQADGWCLRQDIIWAKLAPMPEPVKNRCTKSHEYVFLLAKSNRYFFDAEAIKEKSQERASGVVNSKDNPASECGTSNTRHTIPYEPDGTGRNKRSVWSLPPDPYGGAHFACFPRSLVEPCVLAGTSAKGACGECGAPWRRVTEPDANTAEAQEAARNGQDWYARSWDNSNKRRTAKSGDKAAGGYVSRYETTGWQPTCECHGKLVKRRVVVQKERIIGNVSAKNAERLDSAMYSANSTLAAFKTADKKTVVEYVSDLPLDEHPVRPCIVLDPFMGSGTTACVAIKHGRWSWGIELSEEYLTRHQVKRVKKALMSVPHGDLLLPDEPKAKVLWKARAVRLCGD